jgi:glutamate racemase
MGSNVKLIDSGAETVGEVSTLLDYFQMANTTLTTERSMAFYTTGSTKMFDQIAKEWLKENTISSKHIALGEEKS